MAEKEIRIHNKSDRPDNVIQKENDIYLECEKIEKQLPKFMRGYFSYLKSNVLPATRLAYLHDGFDGGRRDGQNQAVGARRSAGG